MITEFKIVHEQLILECGLNFRNLKSNYSLADTTFRKIAANNHGY